MPRVRHYAQWIPDGYSCEISDLQWRIIQILQEKKEQPSYSDRELAPLLDISDRFIVAQALYYLKKSNLIRSLGIGTVLVDGKQEPKEYFCVMSFERIELEGVLGD